MRGAFYEIWNWNFEFPPLVPLIHMRNNNLNDVTVFSSNVKEVCVKVFFVLKQYIQNNNKNISIVNIFGKKKRKVVSQDHRIFDRVKTKERSLL